MCLKSALNLNPEQYRQYKQEIRIIEASSQNRTDWPPFSVLIGALKYCNTNVPACGGFRSIQKTVTSRQRLILKTTRLWTENVGKSIKDSISNQALTSKC